MATGGSPGPGGEGSSILSIGANGSILSIGSTGSILSIGSAGSILSIGSAGSFASIGSFGSLGSFASAFSIGSIWSFASVLSGFSAGTLRGWGDPRKMLRLRKTVIESRSVDLNGGTAAGRPAANRPVPARRCGGYSKRRPMIAVGVERG